MSSIFSKISWWKPLGFIIFAYVIIGGLSVPLKPGIINLSTTKLIPGQNSIEITGYNTLFDQGETKVWLKADQNHVIEATSLLVHSSTLMNATFSMPTKIDDIEGNFIPFTLIVYNKSCGSAILPDGFSFENKDTTHANSSNGLMWTKNLDSVSTKEDQGIRFPYRAILNETIRNVLFHVALWMAMFVMLVSGVYFAAKYLYTKDSFYDKKSYALTIVGILYGMLGLATGSLWAKFTWGTWWTNDVKLNMAAISMLIYLAYIILRQSINDHDRKARLSAVYAIFAFVAIIPLLFVLPRLNDSLHPGNGGNPALGGEDLDNTLRMFFYPSIFGFILIGCWLAQIKWRHDVIEEKIASE